MTAVQARRPRGPTGRLARDVAARKVSRPLGLVSIGTVLLLWYLVTGATGLVSPAVLASPEQVAVTFGDLAVHPFAGSTLLQHAAASVHRWVLGYVAAIVLGVPIGAAFAWYPDTRSAFNPIFETLRYIPPFAWVPLAILWFGASTTAEASVVFIAAFPPCVINTHRGLSSLDPLLIRAARTMGASRLATLVDVALPTSTPALVTGARIAVSNGWMALMGAELIVGRKGLGFLINAGLENGESAVIIVGMLSIAITGTILDFVVVAISRSFTRWRKGVSAGE